MASPLILVTSVGRHALPQDSSGFVRVIDWESQRMMMQSSIPESVNRHRDLNPRGGLRGARGVSTCGNRIVIANTERLFIFDANWAFQGDLSHPWMGEVHDILAEEDGIWVTAAASDLLFKIDWRGRILQKWQWRQDRRLTRAFGMGYLSPVKTNMDYRDPIATWINKQDVIHLNAVSRCPEGLLLSFGKVRKPMFHKLQRLACLGRRFALELGLQPLLTRRNPLWKPASDRATPRKRPVRSTWAIVLLRENGKSEILARVEGTSVPNHNVVQVDDRLIYNDTNGGRVVSIPRNGDCPPRSVAVPGAPSFARGLAILDRHRVLVGSQYPPAVYEINLKSGEVVKGFSWKGGQHEAVYNVALLPSHVASPPKSLIFETGHVSWEDRIAQRAAA